MFVGTEGALHVSIDYYNAVWSRHLELQICVVRDCIEMGESSSSEQCMIATMEGDHVEDQVFASEIIQ